MGRSVLAIVVGYLVFGLSAALLFGLSGVDPHAAPSVVFAAVSILYGMVFAALAGFVAASVAPRKAGVHSRIFMAPAALVGGRIDNLTK